MPEATDNRTLYDLGRGYARRVRRRLSSAWDERTAVAEVAKAARKGVKEVRTAFGFARHVDAIAQVVPDAREAILDGGHPHLTPAVVARIATRSEAGIRTAMARAAAGLHPFAPDSPSDLPLGQAPWHFDLSRLHAAQTLLERAACVGRPEPPVTPADRADLTVHATAIRAAIAAMQLVLGGRSRKHPATSAGSGVGGGSGVVGWVADARTLVEAVTGDLLRAAHTRPVAPARDQLAGAVRAVAAAAEAVRARFPAAVEPVPAPAVAEGMGGPSPTGGTYVIVLRADNPGVVRLGRLGSFWLPAGHLLYVGSAFQAGGVAGRIRRHLGGTGPRLWGVDDLRGFAAPVEVWWTHYPDKVECGWATALAAVPGACCPAPGAGATDCKRCPAHLYHVRGRPSCRAFARRLGAAGSGGYAIHRLPRPPAGWGAVVDAPRPGSGPLTPFTCR